MPPVSKTCSACGQSFDCDLACQGQSAMGSICRLTPPGMVVRYPKGDIEVVSRAVSVDTKNFHEGMIDFYDETGNLLRQIDMSAGITWHAIEADEP